MKPKSPILQLFSLIFAALAAGFLALANVSCAAGGGGDGNGSGIKPSVSFDLVSGVCVKTERGAVCYHPGNKAWTLKVAATGATEALTIVRQDDESVTLRTASGGELTYRNGSIEWPAEPDASGK